MVIAFVKRQKIEHSKLNRKWEPSVTKQCWNFSCVLLIPTRLCKEVRRASGGAAPLAHAHTDLPDSQACCSPAAGCQTMADAAPACPSLDAKWSHLVSLQTSLMQFVIRPIPDALIVTSNKDFNNMNLN